VTTRICEKNLDAQGFLTRHSPKRKKNSRKWPFFDFPTPKKGFRWAQNYPSNKTEIDTNGENYLPCDFQPNP